MAKNQIKKPSAGKSRAGASIPDFVVTSFGGLITSIQNPHQIPKGHAQDELNWITGEQGDNIQLRMGTKLLGKTRNLGTGHISGLAVGSRKDARQIPIFTYDDPGNGQIAKYYDQTTDDTIPVTNNGAFTHLLPVAADADDVAIEPYANLAGYFMYISSPHSSIYKIHLADPGYALDMQSYSFRGYMKIKQNRMFLWNNHVKNSGAVDAVGLYQSKIDWASYGQYFGAGYISDNGGFSQDVLGSGDGTTKTFAGNFTYFGLNSAFPKQSGFNILVVGQGASETITQITNDTNAEITTASAHGLALGDLVIASGIPVSVAGTGTASAAMNSPYLTGSGTHFTTELQVGSEILIANTQFTVTQIFSDTSLQMSSSPVFTFNAQAFNILSMSQINSLVLTVIRIVDATHFVVSQNTQKDQGFLTYAPLSGGKVGKGEFFIDDGVGNLTSNLGGTGTVNYSSGAYSVTFNTAPITGAGDVVGTYLVELSTLTINNFGYSTPRIAGDGNYYPQFPSGPFMSLYSFEGVEYCLHLYNAWALTVADGSGSDLNPTNIIYRGNLGIPYWRAATETDNGIPYLDFSQQTNPRFQTIAYNEAGNVIIPTELSVDLDLTVQGFDHPAVFEWGDYQLLACQSILNGTNNPQNNVTYVRNRITGFWDKTDIQTTVLAEYNGGLLAGDSLSNNVFEVFSGYDDDNNIINNYRTEPQYDLEIDGLKRFYRFYIEGYINPSQSFGIWMQFDSGEFINVGMISGTGPYVDMGSGILVGSQMMGSQVIGQAGTGVNAYHFEYEFLVASPVFQYVTPQFIANAIGALQINQYAFRDIRYKGRRAPLQYMQPGNQ
jgi:hypothetical protein